MGPHPHLAPHQIRVTMVNAHCHSTSPNLWGSPKGAFELARSYAADQMRIVQSGSERKDLLAA